MPVSGGYCQHTEGFGEMAEKRNRWRASQRKIECPFLLIAVALSELELQSSHPHPAGAPRRPPEPACRGRLSIHLDAGRPCVTQSSTSNAEDRLRHCLLLLPTLRRLLRRRFLRFSLLRHCCPPSLSGWRYRYSAVANRSALHSDYYSGRKITGTPLNFVCKRRRRRDYLAATFAATRRSAQTIRVFQNLLRVFLRNAKNADEIATFVDFS
jgi:hypothetical protein